MPFGGLSRQPGTLNPACLSPTSLDANHTDKLARALGGCSWFLQVQLWWVDHRSNGSTLVQVGAPEEEEQDGFNSPFSPSPSPRGLMPEGSFVDESGRVVGGGESPRMATLGPRLDARLVAVFSPRSMPGQPANALVHTHTQPVRLPVRHHISLYPLSALCLSGMVFCFSHTKFIQAAHKLELSLQFPRGPLWTETELLSAKKLE